jgi:hypothetical protein
MSFPFLFENASFEINLEAIYMGIPGRYFTIEPVPARLQTRRCGVPGRKVVNKECGMKKWF